MTGPDADRVVQVISDKFATGYLIRPGVVITAAHGLQGAEPVWVVGFRGDRSTWEAEVAGVPLRSETADLAVLLCTTPPEIATGPVEFGRVERGGADKLPCTGTGFPRFMMREDTVNASVGRDSHTIHGWVSGAGLRTGDLTIATAVDPPEPDPSTCPWGGVSGTAVFTDGRVIGLVKDHHHQQGPQLTLTTVLAWYGHLTPGELALATALLGLPTTSDELAVCRPNTGHLERSAPIEYAAGPTGLRTRTFEERYRSYMVERHSQLRVVGLDLSRPERAGWPLDAAYLSLELAEQSENWGEASEDAVRPPGVVKRAEHALAGCQRVLLRGLAGSGKTTLLQWLAVAAARRDLPEELASWRGRVPFVLPLRTLVRRGPLPDPHDFLAAVGTPLAASQPEGWADGVLSRGEALVLVDGIDEVPLEQRAATREWLEQLLAAYQDAYFVVTTRPSAVPEGWLASSGFAELSVRPMSAADTGVFVGRWHAAARNSAASDAERSHLDHLEVALRVTVRTQRNLAQLSTTPLMCALICALHRDRRGHLPHGRMELYQAALSMLLVRRDLERSIEIPEGIQLTEHQSVQLLQRLAYWLIRNGQSEMDYTTALALVSDALPAMQTVAEQGTSEHVLAHLIGRSGLLRQPTMDTVDFVHRTFQDYLGAKAAIEAHDFPLLVNHAHDDQWEDVIRMAIAHARPAESADLLRRLVKRGDTEREHQNRLHLLAAASLRYATEIEPDVRNLVEQRARSLMPPRSDEEAEELAALGPGVLDLLPGPHGLKMDEKDAVIHTVANIGGDQAYAFLQHFMQSDPRSGFTYELMRAWRYFDAGQYAQDILRPHQGQLSLSVENYSQYQALPILKPVKSITFREKFTRDEIVQHLSPGHTHTLRIYSGELLEDLQFVRDFPALRELAVAECSQLATLDDLEDLSLSGLALLQMSPNLYFGAIHHLPELTELSLYTRLPWADLTGLPAPDGLTSLRMGASVRSRLTGISRWQRLEDLVTNTSLTPAEWREILDLPNLANLNISDYDLAQAIPIPSVTHLGLTPIDADLQLAFIPEVFPGLTHISINCRRSLPDITDISPLSGIDGLHVTLNRPKEIVGLENFSPEKISLHPRPRGN